MPQTAGAAVPVVLAAAPAVADTVWMSICVYTASNPHALNRMVNTLKSLPRLWVQKIKQFAKDLESKAKEKVEKNESKNAFGFGAELKDEIEKLFVHVKNDSKIEGFDEYDGVFAGIFERSSKKSSTSASSRSNINSGGGSAMPPDPEKDPKKERKGTEGYKTGQTWESLKPVNKPEANRQIGKINKQAFGGGEMRTDGEKLYRFDNGHKNGKIHMEVYKKTSKGWQPYAECDPETGAILEGSLEEMATREAISW